MHVIRMNKYLFVRQLRIKLFCFCSLLLLHRLQFECIYILDRIFFIIYVSLIIICITFTSFWWSFSPSSYSKTRTNTFAVRFVFLSKSVTVKTLLIAYIFSISVIRMLVDVVNRKSAVTFKFMRILLCVWNL
jgi:hypothetical protein